MKTRKVNIFAKSFLLLGIFALAIFTSCKDDKPAPDPIASFQYAISEDNWKEVTFTNYSQHAESYSWAFGDGETSTEENPTHVFPEADSYTVTLTATNKDGVSIEFSQSITITDPYAALRLLAGETSKTWKLYREGISMLMDPHWEGLSNDGARPCLYLHEFTFHIDGKYVFDDKDSFWGEYGVWGAVEGFDNSPLFETCFAAIPENMFNAKGDDVSAWLSGTHSYTYNPSAGTATITGEGAWIGIPKLGTDGETLVPVSSVTFNLALTEHTGYDLMTVTFNYGDITWQIVYVNYSDPSLEPELVTEAEEWGEDLENITPTELYHTFESETSFVHIGAIGGASPITVGQDDPAGGTTKVGKFERIASDYQEAQLRVSPDPKDIQFDNFETAKIDIYIPSGTVFADGGLKKHIVFGFADMSQTKEWWTSPTQFVVEGEDVVIGEWKTYEFDLTDVKARQDLDMIFLGIGGGGHSATGTFYVRNLTFE